MIDFPKNAAAFVVSHTHWDREWYETFQQFRLRLVDLVDKVIDLLDHTPGYEFFMLDGQAIVLADYLAMRPEREDEIRRLVLSGRLLIGPWYVLPDEFLVSPEALIRNLQRGIRESRRFGAVMPVGYIPDPFGHIGQMPQLLRGFGITEAALARGLGDEPVELWWEAPDGSRVLLIYLRAGYGNLAWIPLRADLFVEEFRRRTADFLAGAVTPNALLLNGTDHLYPQEELPHLLAAAREALPELAIRHSTLPEYIAAVRAALPAGGAALPVVSGELRSPAKLHLLPSVASTRIWIKQANDAAERLLERYAEPLNAWSHRLGGPNRAAQLDEAWRLLLENHPHDSICGCSIDQVHEEMEPRFAGVMQIGTALAHEGLARLAGAVDAPSPANAAAAPEDLNGGSWEMGPWPSAERAVIVYNPTLESRADRVEVDVRLPGPPEAIQMVAVGEEAGVLPAIWLDRPDTRQSEQVVGGDEFRRILAQAAEGHFYFRRIRNLRLIVKGARADLEFLLRDDERAPDMTALRDVLARIRAEAPLDTVAEARVRIRLMATGRVAFVAPDVPGQGYRAFLLRSSGGAETGEAESGAGEPVIENEYLRVSADREAGTFTLVDRRTGSRFAGLNLLVDDGDAGDEYSYSPPLSDRIVAGPAAPASVEVRRTPVGQSLTLQYTMHVPAALTPDRAERSPETVALEVVATAALAPGVVRLDLTTTVDNGAKDHRLRAHFPVHRATASWAEAHFDVVSRPTEAPGPRPEWPEDPPATFPQRGWTAIQDEGGHGLLVAAKGLPEAETTPQPGGPLAVKLTLLRCVGDLSRADLQTRRGHAGPTCATPGAQCLGVSRFEYSVIPYTGGWASALPAAEAFRTPFWAVSRAAGSGALPPAASLLDIESLGANGASRPLLSAVKVPEDRMPGLVVRLWNPGAATIAARVRSLLPLVSAHLSDLREQPGEPLLLEGDAFSVTLGPKQVVTVRLQ